MYHFTIRVSYKKKKKTNNNNKKKPQENQTTKKIVLPCVWWKLIFTVSSFETWGRYDCLLSCRSWRSTVLILGNELRRHMASSARWHWPNVCPRHFTTLNCLNTPITSSQMNCLSYNVTMNENVKTNRHIFHDLGELSAELINIPVIPVFDERVERDGVKKWWEPCVVEGKGKQLWSYEEIFRDEIVNSSASTRLPTPLRSTTRLYLVFPFTYSGIYATTEVHTHKYTHTQMHTLTKNTYCVTAIAVHVYSIT